jgi:hypothetical protein
VHDEVQRQPAQLFTDTLPGQLQFNNVQLNQPQEYGCGRQHKRCHPGDYKLQTSLYPHGNRQGRLAKLAGSTDSASLAKPSTAQPIFCPTQLQQQTCASTTQH